MENLINWIKKNRTLLVLANCFITIFFVGLLILFQMAEYKAELRENNIRINKLLNANNSLTKKVVEYQIKEKQQIDGIRDYILRHYRTVPYIVAIEIAKNVIIASEKYNLPVATIMGVMEVESSFNASAIGKKTKYGKARGLMQVMPAWWLEELNLSSKYDLHNIKTGINSGTYVLKKYLEEKNNNMEKALFKYVNGDEQYVKDVYTSMGKFVVFTELPDNEKEINLKKENLQTNVQLKEESESNVESENEESEAFTHTIKYHGETLSLISKWYTGNIMNWKKIQELNPTIKEYKMQIGAIITLPIEIVKTTNPLTEEYIQIN